MNLVNWKYAKVGDDYVAVGLEGSTAWGLLVVTLPEPVIEGMVMAGLMHYASANASKVIGEPNYKVWICEGCLDAIVEANGRDGYGWPVEAVRTTSASACSGLCAVCRASAMGLDRFMVLGGYAILGEAPELIEYYYNARAWYGKGDDRAEWEKSQ